MVRSALAKGIAPRVELADPAQGAKYIEMGVKHFCIGWDASILHQWWKANGEAMNGMLAGGKGRKKAAPKRKAGDNYR